MPSPATPKLRDLAQRLLRYETVAGQVAEGTEPAVFRVCNKLRTPLSTLAGRTGFRSVVSRALALAKEEVAALNAFQVATDGSLKSSEGAQSQHNPDGAAEGGIVLVAQLLGLLVIFVGEPLTLRLLQEIWPEVPGNDDLKSE